jgi:hypothetical protein
MWTSVLRFHVLTKSQPLYTPTRAVSAAVIAVPASLGRIVCECHYKRRKRTASGYNSY